MPMISRRRVWLAAGLVGGMLASGSAAAAAVLVVQGRGELVSPPLAGDLQVLDAQLEPMLVPGQSSDLVVRLRNRSAVTVTTDRVRLLRPLQDASPAGCTSKVSGPLLAAAGYALPIQQRVSLGPGARGELVVSSGLSLAAGAKAGCGFRVQVEVRATQSPATPEPTRPTTAPVTPPPTTTTPQPPDTLPPTTPTPPPPSTERPPTVPPTLDCDPVDTDCVTS